MTKATMAQAFKIAMDDLARLGRDKGLGKIESLKILPDDTCIATFTNIVIRYDFTGRRIYSTPVEQNAQRDPACAFDLNEVLR